MSIQMENAVTCFKRLLGESKSPKFHASLERVKKACDSIENMRGLLSYSGVAKYTTDHFGGPKRQSIMNSDRLRLYIDYRKEEYTIHSKPPKTFKTKTSSTPDWAKNLDLKTRVRINQLESELTYKDYLLRNLSKNISHDSWKHPIDFDKSISAGVQEDLSMLVIRDSDVEQNNGKLKMICNIVQRLLDFAEDPSCPLKITTRNGRECLRLESGPFEGTVLYDNELIALKPKD